MKIDQAIAIVVEAIKDEPVGRGELVALAVRATLAAVDLHVAPDGEIYSPAPEARFMPPGMEAKWGGGSRRRRAGR